jgi:hypothetical protein
MADTNRTTIELDWTQLLEFGQAIAETGARAPYVAKIGVKQMVRRPGEVDTVAMARLTEVGTTPILDGWPIAALNAKVGTKTFIPSVATATGFRTTLDDRPAASTGPALTFPAVRVPANLSINLDWTQLLGFDQAMTEAGERARYAAKIGIKQMVRRPGEVDSVAMARLTKVGIKGR